MHKLKEWLKYFADDPVALLPFVTILILAGFLVLISQIAKKVEEKVIYLPIKECIVLRTQCNDGLCGTLETYNCEDIIR